MRNFEIAALFHEIADLLEIKNENPFRVRAYRRAGQSLEALTEDVGAVAERGALEEVPGIGRDLAAKIQEYLASGKIAYLEELRKEIPRGVVDLLRIPGVGPKTAKLLFDRLGVDSVDRLEACAREGKLAGLPGVKEKTVENILKGIRVWRSGRERMPLGRALPLAEGIVRALRALPEVREIEAAGSLRRRRETVKDIDILVTSARSARVMEVFTGLPGVAEVLAGGETKSSLRLKEGIQVDLRVVEPEAFGAALQYFTGSKAHNIRVRELAVRKGLKVSEYGVFRERGETRVAGKTEAEVYAAVGLPFIPPELREDTGEIEAALGGRLPALIEVSDIRGDLQLHTNWSDGAHPLPEMVEAVRAKGYEYMIVSDHSKAVGVAGGLDAEELRRQIAEIRQLNRGLRGFRIFAGSEVDIRTDGTLDFPDAMLAELDLVVASVHSGFKMSRVQMTERICRALRSGFVDILAHPTGRLIGERDPYEVDLDAVMAAAREAGTAMEINASPQRLDLSDLHARKAREMGIRLVISTDAHTASQLDNIHYGVAVARRAWVRREDVLNTLPTGELEAWVSRRRRGGEES